MLSALVHYVDKGDEFLHAAEKGLADVTELVAPPAGEPSTAPASPVPTSAPAPALPSSSDLEAQISDLQAQLDARRATEQQTQVEHETSAPPAEAPQEPASVSQPAPPSSPEAA